MKGSSTPPTTSMQGTNGNGRNMADVRFSWKKNNIYIFSRQYDNHHHQSSTSGVNMSTVFSTSSCAVFDRKKLKSCLASFDVWPMISPNRKAWIRALSVNAQGCSAQPLSIMACLNKSVRRWTRSITNSHFNYIKCQS